MNIHVMVGIPASGKSTWIQKQIATNNGIWISRDKIRFSLLKPNEDYFAHENEAFANFIRQINEAIKSEKYGDIYVDATHISPGSRKKLLSRLRPITNCDLVFEVMVTPPKVCIERNELREGRTKVDIKSLQSMISGFSCPTLNEFPVRKYGFQDIKINIHKEVSE